MTESCAAMKAAQNTTDLRPETLERIERLLVLHERNGFNRGLYAIEDLPAIRNKLIELAAWLKDTRASNGDSEKQDAIRFDEKTVLCISYVDHIEGDDAVLPPARRLQQFFNKHLAGLYSHLHILPHFPCPMIHEGVAGPAGRADGGFEAMNYKMDPKYGTPADLKASKAALMFDFVLNHLSTKGDLFENFMNNVPGFEDFFLHLTDEQTKNIDMAPVFRPREHNPIIPFDNGKGVRKNVWCTFSETQADINIKDYRVFNTVMEALIKDFVAEGAKWIRLDAIGYLVKMLGIDPREESTSSFGIEETHNIVKAIRVYLADIAPDVALVPEVNATGEVIATYYGQNDEGHIVYDFPSAPVSLYAIYREDARAVLDWAEQRTQHPERIGLSFTNSHDGIGVLPMAEVKDQDPTRDPLDFFIHQVERRGGGINYKSKLVDGKQTRIPYEACIAWLQAILTPPEAASLHGNRLADDEIKTIVDRFIASQSFIYAGPHCVPADYMGVITGLLNDEKLYQIAGHRRNKNRGLVEPSAFEKAITAPESSYERVRHAIFTRKNALIRARQSSPAFSPDAVCNVDVVESKGQDRPVFSILRRAKCGTDQVLALTNCTPSEQTVALRSDLADLFLRAGATDLLTGTAPRATNGALTLAPYQVLWIKA